MPAPEKMPSLDLLPSPAPAGAPSSEPSPPELAQVELTPLKSEPIAAPKPVAPERTVMPGWVVTTKDQNEASAQDSAVDGLLSDFAGDEE